MTRCPSCSYLYSDYEDLKDHLTYYHFMSTTGVDMVIKEEKERKTAAGEPCGKEYGWWTPKRKLILAISCFTVASIMGYIQYG